MKAFCYFVFFGVVISITACDTMRLYKLDKNPYSSSDDPTEGKRSRQKTAFFDGKVIVYTYLNRFNFTYSPYLEFENNSSKALRFEMKDISLKSKKSSIYLELDECKVKVGKNFSKIESIIVLPGEKKEIVCEFDGTSISKFTHTVESEEQLAVTLEIKQIYFGEKTDSLKLNFAAAK